MEEAGWGCRQEETKFSKALQISLREDLRVGQKTEEFPPPHLLAPFNMFS